MNRRFANSSGFTLIEIIIAISILAAMTMTMTEVTSGIMTSRERAKLRAESSHGLSIAATKLMDDLRQAFQAMPKFQNMGGYYLSGFKGDSASMNFSTMSNIHFVKNNKDTDQIVVGYSLVSGQGGDFNLVRRQTDYLGDDIEVGGRSFVLLENVKEFRLEYYDAGKESWVADWDTSSISAAGKLPQIVKITMVVYGESVTEDEGDRKEYDYELMVPVEMYKNKVDF